MTTTTTNKPAATLRDGRLKATIWKNTGEKGTYHRVDFSRSYQDAKGDWHDSNRFSGTELLRLAHLATQGLRRAGRACGRPTIRARKPTSRVGAPRAGGGSTPSSALTSNQSLRRPVAVVARSRQSQNSRGDRRR